MNGHGKLICFAMKEEAGPFRRMVAGREDVSILITGIGRTNSERRLTEFLRGNHPAIVFTCGFAGGLLPALSQGDVVFQTADIALTEKLARAGARQTKLHCASRIATTAAEKRALRDATNAEAVEMESEVIQAICRERGIPCATVRVISDTANEDLPLDFNQLAKADLSMDYTKLAVAVLKNPAKIKDLLRLQKTTSLAARRLAEVLARVAVD